MATTGKRFSKLAWKAIRRRWYTLIGAAFSLLLLLLIWRATVDFASVLNQGEIRTQDAVLNSELANFLLAVRDDSGTSLLENPSQFAKASRPISVLTLRKPFFTYFLRRNNAGVVSAASIEWDPPSQCVVEFFERRRGVHEGDRLQVCFAEVESDPLGQYVYFAVRYPIDRPLVRHQQGQPLVGTDSVQLFFRGERATSAVLVFELPPFAKERYPSKLSRFDGIHEVSAYQSDGVPLRWVSGQAYEKQEGTSGSTRTTVTVLGRLERSALWFGQSGNQIDRQKLRELQVGLTVMAAGDTTPRFIVDPGAAGTALVSLEQAYLQRVESKARLDVYPTRQQKQLLWSSEWIRNSKPVEKPGLFQRGADVWTNWMIHMFGDEDETPLRAARSVPGTSAVEASVTAPRLRVSERFSRLFLLFSASVVVILGFSVTYFSAIYRLGNLANVAYRIAAFPATHAQRLSFKKSLTELGTFTRILDLLIQRSRGRGRRASFRIQNELVAEREQIKARHAVLEALGHEIRSPLQSLLNRAGQSGPVPADLQRIERAVEVLYDATSLIAAVENGKVVLEANDLAEYVREYAENVSSANMPLRYEGVQAGVVAFFDQLWLDQVLDNLTSNAQRYRTPGTEIVLRVRQFSTSAEFEVFNQGPNIRSEELETVFEYGNSTMDTPENRGIGLFMVRLYMVAMKGAVRAENRPDGVAMLMQLRVPFRNVSTNRAEDTQ